MRRIFFTVLAVFIVGCASSNVTDIGEEVYELPEPVTDKLTDDVAVQESSTTTKATEKPPVLKNLGFAIESLDKKTGQAGDLIFTKQLLYDDGRVSNDKVFIDFGSTDKYNPEGAYIEYWFFVPLVTKARAPADGVAKVVFFEHTQDWGINIHSKESGWIVSFEHVVNVVVRDGDMIRAGDIVGDAAPRGTFKNEIAMTELAVWKVGNGIYKYCPFDFLEDSLKPVYEEKLRILAAEWEEFIDKDIYKQEDWVSPGCLVHKIAEK